MVALDIAQGIRRDEGIEETDHHEVALEEVGHLQLVAEVAEHAVLAVLAEDVVLLVTLVLLVEFVLFVLLVAEKVLEHVVGPLEAVKTIHYVALEGSDVASWGSYVLYLWEALQV